MRRCASGYADSVQSLLQPVVVVLVVVALLLHVRRRRADPCLLLSEETGNGIDQGWRFCVLPRLTLTRGH